jgi:hypothetical protein
MATSRYLEVIKRFLRTEMYFRSRTQAQANADGPQHPAAEEKPQ